MDKSGQEKILKEGVFIRFLQKDNWEYIKRHNCSGIVIILAMTEDGKVLFVEQYRPPVDKMVIEFPAGLIGDVQGKADESLINGAKRELLEETGYQARKIVKLMEGPVSGGSSADIVTVVQAYDLTKVHEGGGDDTEEIIVHEIPLKDCNRWLIEQTQRGLLLEPKIYTGLYFLNQYNTIS